MYLLEKIHFSGLGEPSRLPWSERSEAVFQSPGTTMNKSLLKDAFACLFENVIRGSALTQLRSHKKTGADRDWDLDPGMF